VDSLRVAEAISREATRAARTIDILIEVNCAGEVSKFGFPRTEVLESAPVVSALPGLRVVGLMTVAPHLLDPEATRPLFRDMAIMSSQVQERLGGPTPWQLSMGMTNDFEVAIEEGATIVRVGRALFGERVAPPTA
jgi:uncharacterized pyridoxal phosphate-containing UPF0001 family protein